MCSGIINIVWTPNYRFRIRRNNAGREIYKQIRIASEQLGIIEVVELNVQVDPVHLLVKIPPRLSIWLVTGHPKGKTALRLFSQLSCLRKNTLWGNQFWARRYCVDTAGVNEKMRRRHVKYQEKHEMAESQLPLKKA